MNRRDTIRSILTLLSGCSVGSFGQSKRIPVIGVPLVYAGPHDQIMDALRKGLHNHGYVDGENIRIEHRFAAGKIERVPGLVEELAKLKSDIFVAGAEPIARIQMKISPTTPIVLVAMGFDPFTAGMIGSQNRPGGQITGIYARTGDTVGKQLQLFKDVRPDLSKVAAFYDGWGQNEIASIESLATGLTIRLIPMRINQPYDYSAAFTTAKRNKAEGGILTFSPRFYVDSSKVAHAALAQSFPTLSFEGGYARAGGLMSYAPGTKETWERLAYFIDRILKGDKPGDLPMEEPQTYALAVNLRTAKALGITIPESILLRADEVIR